jgi:MFS family permease
MTRGANATSRPPTRARAFLDRSVVAISVATFLLTFGEELWKRFAPKYLEALGAPVTAIGLYGSTRDLIDGLYQYPGGWIADRYGRRRALTLFVSLAAAGYAVYAAAPSWPVAFLGLALVMSWASMASPALFAVIGDALPVGRRAMGFTIQSILRRIPIAIAPAIGGLLIVRLGMVQGVRAGLVTSLALALVTLLVVRLVNVRQVKMAGPSHVAGVWRDMAAPLRRLLLSDIFIRICEGMVDVFLVLYAINVVGLSASRFGVLIAVQMSTSILVYIPAARRADSLGRKPLVAATFVAFAAFPLAVISAHSFSTLVMAFIVGGLREIGEPARKALIVDLAVPHARARTVGLYYLVRSAAISPAAFVGSLLWRRAVEAPFIVAAAFGVFGLAIFVATVPDERRAA